MTELAVLLNEINGCTACQLMAENNALGIPYVPILPKPHAKVVFVGRDPSPRTAQIVGVPESDSVFIQEVFRLASEAGLAEADVYITDMCKCHWRTSSSGHPLPGTETRNTRLDQSVANTCIQKWLVNELLILSPSLVVGFGEEFYDLLKAAIVTPNPTPLEFSSRADKSVPDAELWFAANGPFTMDLYGRSYPLAVIRHPGNTRQLRASDARDQRRAAHELSRARLIEDLSLLAASR